MNRILSFCDIVRSEFAFLVTELNFTLFREEASDKIEFVEYVSPQVYARVICTGPDFEPKFVFGQICNECDLDSFSWVDLKELNCCRHWKWHSNPDKPYDGRVSELARLLRECGKHCLLGDSETYAFLRNRQHEMKREHLLEVRFLYAMREAEKAWKERRFLDFVSKLVEFRDQLTSLDLKKLAYASKQ